MRDGGVRVAAQAADFQIAISGVERIAERRRGLGRAAQSQHAPGVAGELVSFLPGSRSTLSRCADRDAYIRLRDLVLMPRTMGVKRAVVNCGGCWLKNSAGPERATIPRRPAEPCCAPGRMRGGGVLLLCFSRLGF